MNDLIIKAAKDLAGAKSVAALTGAGISVESGNPAISWQGRDLGNHRSDGVCAH
jgi:NAD-dependent SIR2 family protein deacetylase